MFQGRDGKGSIFVWASGNGGENGDSCAADGYVASIHTIAIGAAALDGSPASFDEQCAGKMAVTFVTSPSLGVVSYSYVSQSVKDWLTLGLIQCFGYYLVVTVMICQLPLKIAV